MLIETKVEFLKSTQITEMPSEKQKVDGHKEGFKHLSQIPSPRDRGHRPGSHVRVPIQGARQS